MHLRSSIIAILFVAGVTVSPTPMARSAAAAETKTLIVGIQSDLAIVDPMITASRITAMVGNLVYETLFARDSHNVPRPEMVGSYVVSPDKLTYEFTLRPGLKWHDGTPVTTADVIASLKRWMAISPKGGLLAANTKSLEPIAGNSFKLVLSKPYGLLLDSLTNASTNSPFIMPERLAKTPPNQQVKTIMGSGPFKFEASQWQPGNRIVFTRAPMYVPRAEPPDGMAGGHVAKVERVVMRYLPDENSALAALKSGAIDYLDEVPFDFLPVIKADPNLKLAFVDNGAMGVVRPNETKPPFNNVIARRAVMHLVDQQEFMQAAVGDPQFYDRFCGSFFICGTASGTEAGSEPYRHKDVAEAKKLFAEAGYHGEPIVVLQGTNRPLYKAWSEVLIQDLREAGINVKVRAQDWAATMSLWAKKDAWDLAIGAVPPSGSDPYSNIFYIPACDKAMFGWPCNKDIMALIGQWSTEFDEEKRHALIVKMNEAGWQFLPYIPIGQYHQPVAVRANIDGVVNTGGGDVFWNISKK